MRKPVSCLILADFNPANLAACLRTGRDGLSVSATGQMIGELRGAITQMAEEIAAADAVLVWTDPGRVSREFARGVSGHTPDMSAVLDDVNWFTSAVDILASRVPTVFVASWVLRPDHRGFGPSTFQHDTGLAALLLRMNLRLIEQLAPAKNAIVLDASRWLVAGGTQAFNPRLWFMAKIPFATGVFQAAARDVKAALRALAGESRRLLILDLDNTLWGGLVGESGWESLRLGGHDPIGEAFVEFQHRLKALSTRGTLLAIASKNDERQALDAIEHHPEMRLRRGDFAAVRINWQDKAENIADILDELNLGPGYAVFVDDQSSERSRVSEALPELLVPDWPQNPMLYPSALLALDCFDTVALTEEDRTRTELYRAEHDRAKERLCVSSVDEWLQRLGLCVRVAELSGASSLRAAQLLNKTNQMNLSTRRLSEPALLEWTAPENRRVWTFRVSDRFGDAGLTGLLSLQVEAESARIVDFVLSCRVLGRRVEEAMLHQAVGYARSIGARKLVARYQPTDRNGPCKQFLERSGLQNGDGEIFWWDVSQPYPAPPFVRIECEGAS